MRVYTGHANDGQKREYGPDDNAIMANAPKANNYDRSATRRERLAPTLSSLRRDLVVLGAGEKGLKRK